MALSSGHPVDGQRILKIVARPSCAPGRGGCTTSLPAKTGTTRRQLRESWGKLREAWRKLREPSERSVVRRQLRASRRTLRTSGATLRNQGVVPGGLGDRSYRASGRCPGPVVGRAGCGSPIAPAASSPGQSAGYPCYGQARPLHLIHAGAASFFGAPPVNTLLYVWQAVTR